MAALTTEQIAQYFGQFYADYTAAFGSVGNSCIKFITDAYKLKPDLFKAYVPSTTPVPRPILAPVPVRGSAGVIKDNDVLKRKYLNDNRVIWNILLVQYNEILISKSLGGEYNKTCCLENAVIKNFSLGLRVTLRKC